MVDADALLKLNALGLTAEQYAGVIEVLAIVTRNVTQNVTKASPGVTSEQPATPGAIRMRRYRERHAASHKRHSVTPTPSPSPEKESFPPAPPFKEKQTPPPTHDLDMARATVPKLGAPLPRGWVLPKTWGEWALREFPQLSALEVRQVADEFRDYWIGVPGAKGRKLDWEATWRNRIRAYIARRPRAGPAAPPRKSNLQRLTEEFQQELANDGHGDQSQEGRNPHDDERLSLIAGSRDG